TGVEVTGAGVDAQRAVLDAQVRGDLALDAPAVPVEGVAGEVVRGVLEEAQGVAAGLDPEGDGTGVPDVALVVGRRGDHRVQSHARVGPRGRVRGVVHGGDRLAVDEEVHPHNLAVDVVRLRRQGDVGAAGDDVVGRRGGDDDLRRQGEG